MHLDYKDALLPGQAKVRLRYAWCTVWGSFYIRVTQLSMVDVHVPARKCGKLGELDHAVMVLSVDKERGRKILNS